MEDGRTRTHRRREARRERPSRPSSGPACSSAQRVPHSHPSLRVVDSWRGRARHPHPAPQPAPAPSRRPSIRRRRPPVRRPRRRGSSTVAEPSSAPSAGRAAAPAAAVRPCLAASRRRPADPARARPHLQLASAPPPVVRADAPCACLSSTSHSPRHAFLFACAPSAARRAPEGQKRAAVAIADLQACAAPFSIPPNLLCQTSIPCIYSFTPRSSTISGHRLPKPRVVPAVRRRAAIAMVAVDDLVGELR